MLARRNASFLLAIVVGFAVTAGLAALLGGCMQTPTSTPTPTKTPAIRRARVTPTAIPLPLALVISPQPAIPLAPSPVPPTASATISPPTPTNTASPTSSPTRTPTTVPTATPTATATSTATSTATLAPTVTPRSSVTRPPTSRPAAIPTASPLKDRVWDPRLTQRGATLIPAQVKPGQGYWRLVEAKWFDEGEPPFDGKHNIYIDTLDPSGKRQTGVRILMASLDNSQILGYVNTEAKPGEPYAASFGMFVVAPAYRVQPATDAPADAVSGLGLGSLTIPNLPTLTSYGFIWQWTIAR